MELTFEAVLEAFDAALELVDDDEQREKLSRVVAASGASVERATQDLVAAVIDEVNADLGGRSASICATHRTDWRSQSRPTARPSKGRTTSPGGSATARSRR